MIMIIILYALFASSVIGSKLAVAYTQPFFLTGFRMLISGSILLTYQYFFARHKFKFDRQHIWLYAQVTVIGVLGAYTLRLFSLRHMTAAKAMFLQNVGPFISALFAYAVFKHKLSKKQWVGLVIGFLGIIPILLTSDKGMSDFFFISWAEVAVLLAAACYSWNWIIMQKLVREKDYSPMMINGLTMTSAGILGLSISTAVEGFAPVTAWGPFLATISFVIIISNLICHNIYGNLLHKYSATFLSFAGFLSPIFAAFYGWAFFSEKITWHYYLSGAIVLIALYLFYQDELKNEALTQHELEV